MKKTYEKPAILFESFVTSTNIAGNCTLKTHTPAAGSCSYSMVVGDKWRDVFVSNVNACELKDGDDTDKNADGVYGGICYHVSVDGQGLFNS